MDPASDIGPEAFLERAERARLAGDVGAWSVVLDQAIALHPDHAQLRGSRAMLLLMRGAHADALEDANKAFALDPDNLMIVVLLARLLAASGDRARVVELYARVPEESPFFLEAQREIVSQAALDEDIERAATTLTIQLRAGRGTWRDWLTLSRTSYNKARYGEAMEILEEGILLTDDPVLRMHRALTFPKLSRSRVEMESAQESAAHHLRILRGGNYRIPRIEVDVARTAFHHSYHHGNGKPLQEAYADACLSLAPDLLWTSPQSRTPVSRRIPRIGFISMHFGYHVVGKSLLAMLRRIAPEDAEAVAIHLGGPGAVKFPIPIVHVSPHLAKAREQIAALDLDMLVYTDIGTDAPTYYLAFSRLARIQAVLPGYGLTSGIPAIDYFINYTGWEGPGNVDEHYTETLARIDTLPYFFEPEAFERVPLPADKDRRPLYLATQALYKYHPDIDPIFAGILNKDPGAKLTMVSRMQGPWLEVLLDRWRGLIDNLDERLDLSAKLERNLYFSLIASADCCLDTPQHASGSTAFEILSLGTPLVTMPSPYFRSRQGAGLCILLGASELVVPDADAYIDTAVRLAHDSTFRADIKDRLAAHRDRMVVSPQAVKTFIAALLSLLERGRPDRMPG